MNNRLLELYKIELRHVRQMAAEFARENPKIAGRLALDSETSDACPDPFVERLLEGFAFMSARVNLKLESEFPKLTQGLMETVYPQYLGPTPAMVVAQLELEPDVPPAGHTLPRGSLLRSIPARAQDQTACTFSTGNDLKLLPIRLAEACYHTRDLGALELKGLTSETKAAVRVRLEAPGPDGFTGIDLNRLNIHLAGAGDVPGLLYREIFSHCHGALLVCGKGFEARTVRLGPECIVPIGFAEEEALFPPAPRGFDGYRLLREFFAFPKRFHFLELRAPGRLQGFETQFVDVLFLLDRQVESLSGRVSREDFKLFAVPAINLFPRHLDEVELSGKVSEFPLTPDHTRLLDFEVFEVLSVAAIGSQAGEEIPVRPFYWTKDVDSRIPIYYTLHRVPRELTARERTFGQTSEYRGAEIFLSLCDGQKVTASAPANGAPDLNGIHPLFQKLRVRALCTNRHLPIQMPVGLGRSDFDVNFPFVARIRCLGRPSFPVSAVVDGELAWKLISHLSLNYLSLAGEGPQGAAALKDLASLYSGPWDHGLKRQLDGILSLTARPVHRRIPIPGPICFGRGLQLQLQVDERSFEGTGACLFGAVMSRFFSRYVSINSFVETVLNDKYNQEIAKWPPMLGSKPIL